MIDTTFITQKISSANTSINSTKLPKGFGVVRWDVLPSHFRLLDYGGGRYTQHVKEFVESKGGTYWNYDRAALASNPHIILCNNVLNVIQEDEIIFGIINKLTNYDVPVIISIYEGDKSGVGKVTTKGYQRNQKTDEYLTVGFYRVHSTIITNSPNHII